MNVAVDDTVICKEANTGEVAGRVVNKDKKIRGARAGFMGHWW